MSRFVRHNLTPYDGGYYSAHQFAYRMALACIPDRNHDLAVSKALIVLIQESGMWSLEVVILLDKHNYEALDTTISIVSPAPDASVCAKGPSRSSQGLVWLGIQPVEFPLPQFHQRLIDTWEHLSSMSERYLERFTPSYEQ